MEVYRGALRLAGPLPLRREAVEECLDLDRPGDRLFHTAWTRSLDALPRNRRGGALGGITGHVAESVVEAMFVAAGYVPLAHHPGPGRRGVDLLMLHLACEMVFVVEVKGTLRAGRMPRLTRGELDQMSAAWIDKPTNLGMIDAGLTSADVYGAIAVVNFADQTLRVVFSEDLITFTPVVTADQLGDPASLRT
jgi:hypothetical protein